MPAGLRLGWHAHATGQLVFVMEGSYWERWGRQRHGLSPGSVFFRPPEEPHANIFRTDVLTLVVSYERARIPARASRWGPTELPFLLIDLCRQLELELRRQDPSAMALEGLALLVLSRVERSRRLDARPPWVADALGLIARRHAESITLAALAADLGIHRATLAAAFRRYLGRSVGEAIRDARLQSALREIAETGRPLSEIALDCGFYDQAHMGRLVRRATGRTPGEIRRGR